MQITTLAKLQQRSIALYSKSVPLYEIYNSFIHPNLNSHHLNFEINAALSKPLVNIKCDKTLFLTHSYPLFNLLKSVDISDKTLIKEILIVEVKDDFYNFDLAFYELIGMVSRYHKIIELEPIYRSLKKLITSDKSKNLFDKNDLSIVAFCKLINIPKRTYYNKVGVAYHG